MKTILAILIVLFAMVPPSIAESLTQDFLRRLALVESGGDDSAVNPAEDAHGRYQIRPCYLADANEFMGWDYTIQDMHDPVKAARVVVAYMVRYGSAYVRRTGLPVSPEILARIHNGGPNGWAKAATDGYAERFSATP